jgi:hypothetical protein
MSSMPATRLAVHLRVLFSAMPTCHMTRRRVLGGSVALAAAALLGACGGSAPQRDGAGAVSKAGEISLLSLRVGDCVSDLRQRFENPDGGHNGVPRVEAVPCANPHDGEVLLIAPLAGKDWPGETIVGGEAARGQLALQGRLDRATSQGGARARQRLRLLSFRPTQERWEFENQHKIVYLVLYRQPQRGRL